LGRGKAGVRKLVFVAIAAMVMAPTAGAEVVQALTPTAKMKWHAPTIWQAKHAIYEHRSRNGHQVFDGWGGCHRGRHVTMCLVRLLTLAPGSNVYLPAYVWWGARHRRLVVQQVCDPAWRDPGCLPRT
jgi:hypothetical protein